MMATGRAVLIAGATASGKSALALNLAARLDGVIVNADSMQVYRDLRVITARPTDEETARAEHRLYGHVDAAENYSVGRYCRDAATALAEVWTRGKLPILVGGTGLYFTALTRGLAAVPPIPAELRTSIRARLQAEGVEPLYAELARLDPAGAGQLRPNDRARVTRALEVVAATGRPLADWHREGLPPALAGAACVKVFIHRDRTELYRRIEARFDAMIAAGALAEVERLAARGLDPTLPAMKAHGVPWLVRHLRGEIGLTEAVAGGTRDTRRYTKRQATWFRHQLPDFTWIAPDQAERAIDQALTQGTPETP